jgi:hypothetical protein
MLSPLASRGEGGERGRYDACMPQQYVARDNESGLEVQVTGEFPADPDDRVRVARTTNLFTRLMAAILGTSNDTERRERFRAVETQLEVADALVRGDMAEVQRLVRDTLRHMGVTEDQMREVERQLRDQMGHLGGAGLEALEGLFGAPSEEDEPPPEDDRPLDDRL